MTRRGPMPMRRMTRAASGASASSGGSMRPSRRSPAPRRGVVAAGADQDARRRALALPLGRLGPEVAVGVGAGDAQHQHRRQLALRADAAAALLEQAVAAHLGEELLQLGLGGALEPEGAGDLALAGLAGIVAQQGEDSSGVEAALTAWAAHGMRLPAGG